ncbi:MAG: sigma-70 family RNA polymerase sigma factor [Planctomycetia bacterium]|nr:sigma-70 family RNA polymerase sigma factor [Planctomycetia bacterium]
MADAVEVDANSPQRSGLLGIDRYIESYRNYLLLLANMKIAPAMRCKIGASDLVQETMLAAHRDRERFRGGTEAELRQWLVRVLTCNLLDAEKALRRRCRDVGRETSVFEEPAGALVDPSLTPGRKAVRAEEHAALLTAIERMPEHYGQVLVLRSIEQLSFSEVSLRTGKSVEAVRHIWFRAVKQLGRELATR